MPPEESGGEFELSPAGRPIADVVAEMFVDADGEPQLIPCALLYLDVLGVAALAQDQAQSGLVALDRVFRRLQADFLAETSPWPAAVFSDLFVLAAPVVAPDGEESALGGLVIQAAQLQLDLFRSEELFARGALTLGPLYMRGGVTYGGALVEAYQLESTRARHPRVLLSAAATASQRHALTYYASPEESPENLFLLNDDAGDTFINYLALLLDDPAEDPRPAVELHRDVVTKKLEAHRGAPFWEKYRWVADYHNAFCDRYFPDAEMLRVAAGDAEPRFPAFAV